MGDPNSLINQPLGEDNKDQTDLNLDYVEVVSLDQLLLYFNSQLKDTDSSSYTD